MAALVAVLLASGAASAIEPNPFLPPTERADDIEARLQKRIDKAVSAAEDRLIRAVVDALNGKEPAGMPAPVKDAVARRGAAPATSANTGMPPGLPGLPPLPNVASAGGGSAEVVPAGAVFIGCLDGKAFFQDRAGSPFLVDPRAFPPSSGGAGACGR